ncbi:polyphosphate kinase 2 [Aquabacterium sp. J223]|nr:polyphosphate kinase 2 [Aquabacterium sp. J223]UUX94447.1 polyphosphate kinase 2 [Aquabacterium sp. J223]
MLDRLGEELLDDYDEELELDWEDRLDGLHGGAAEAREAGSPLPRRRYFGELFRLQRELVKLQDWVVASRHKLVIVFEGRDAAGKGGMIKRITQRLNPRVARVVALPAPNDRERTQWYFQRYAAHLPAAGEIVLFDRSWYNRAGVERVMGFCTEDEVEEFFRSVPEFERMLVRSGIQLVKYWFSITDEAQHLRFLGRMHDPLKQWKLSPMDLESRRRWEDYTKAKEDMLARTHIPESPLVGGAGGGQEAGAAELHRPPAGPGALQRGAARAAAAARAGAPRGLQPPPGAGADARAGGVLARAPRPGAAAVRFPRAATN